MEQRLCMDWVLKPVVAQCLKGGISHLIYLTGYAVNKGVAMIDKAKEFGHKDLVPTAFDFAEDDSCISQDPKTLFVGPGADDAEIEAYLETLVRWNGKCMYQALENCACLETPVVYIYTTEDITMPVDYQKSVVEGIEKTGRKLHTFELATGHCPNFTATGGVVDAINKVVVS